MLAPRIDRSALTCPELEELEIRIRCSVRSPSGRARPRCTAGFHPGLRDISRPYHARTKLAREMIFGDVPLESGSTSDCESWKGKSAGSSWLRSHRPTCSNASCQSASVAPTDAPNRLLPPRGSHSTATSFRQGVERHYRSLFHQFRPDVYRGAPPGQVLGNVFRCHGGRIQSRNAERANEWQPASVTPNSAPNRCSRRQILIEFAFRFLTFG